MRQLADGDPSESYYLTKKLNAWRIQVFGLVQEFGEQEKG
jgi:hypothetical protein